MDLKTKNGFDRMKEAELLVKANSIISGITGKEYFPAPIPTLDVVQAATAAYATALVAAATSDRTAVAVKNEKKTELITILRRLCDYVNVASNGDIVKLTSSNCPITGTKQPALPLQKPEAPILSPGVNLGEIVAETKAVRLGKSCVHMIAPCPITDETVWKNEQDTFFKHTFSGLQSGVKYGIKIGVVGSKKQYVESDVVTYIAQ